MDSIFHFFRYLVASKQLFKETKKLEDFSFDQQMLSCKNEGQFPDLAIKVNPYSLLFKGGELLELKDSNTYSVSSFNSTIPTGKKEIKKLLKGKNSKIKRQMEEAGDDIFSLPLRDVYYLVRGQKKAMAKICLIHGSFFETVKSNDLLSQAFSQVLEERLHENEQEINQEIKDLLIDMFSEQSNFSKVRNVDKASVKLRFRVMTEVKAEGKAEGNILNEKKYPEIKDNTLNFIVPCHNQTEEDMAKRKMALLYVESPFTIFRLKHLLNGYFLVFQISLA